MYLIPKDFNNIKSGNMDIGKPKNIKSMFIDAYSTNR